MHAPADWPDRLFETLKAGGVRQLRFRAAIGVNP
jgi:hypothetical protein